MFPTSGSQLDPASLCGVTKYPASLCGVMGRVIPRPDAVILSFRTVMRNLEIPGQ